MHKLTIIAITALLGSAAFAAGEVYRWKDAAGVVHYSDQQQPGAELVRGTRTPATTADTTSNTAAPASTPAAAAPAAAPAAVPAAASDAPLPVSKEVAQEVRQEAATAKAEQCEEAKVQYAKVVQARRISKKDAKGNLTYMTEAEMDAARLQARSNRDLACGT